MSRHWELLESDGEDFSDVVSHGSYVMYHGTTRRKANAIRNKGFRSNVFGVVGRGIYLSRDLDKACRYPIRQPEHNRVVVKVMVDVGNVICIDRRNHPRRKTWHDSRYGEAYDTAWVPAESGVVADNMEMECVLDPDKITFLEIITLSDGPYNWSMNDCNLPSGMSLLHNSAPLNDKTYVMYHGTTMKAVDSIKKTGFRRSTDGMLGCGVYLSKDLNKAIRYPLHHPDSDKVIIRVRVNVGKVITIKYINHPRRKTWHDSDYGEVYDTAWVPPNCEMALNGLEENCVWDPERIQILNIFKLTPV